MNRNILTVLAVALGLSAFGQTQPVGIANLAPPSNPVTSIPIGSGQSGQPVVINNPLVVSATYVNNNTPGGQTCIMHDLNEAHYASRGLLNEYRQSSLAGAQSAETMSFPETPNPNEISVIFHVVHNPSNPAENVSNAQIMSVFQELQEDFQLLNSDASLVRTGFGFVPADADINFCLATQDPSGNPLVETGVVRVSTSQTWFDSSNGEENSMKSAGSGGSDIWNRNNYLNIWICNISNGASSGVAGYAYRPTPTLLPSPSIDGIVLDYNLGLGASVLTHEVGHYLGLDHTWGGSGSCSTDDGFTDTPNTIGPADNQPGFSCGAASLQTCGSTEVQYENYMDYATGCTYMFTQEQANYMLSILQGIRGSLLLSPGCDPTNTPPNSAFSSFPAGPAPVIIPQNASVNFYDESTNAPTGWTWTISGTQGTDWQWIGGTDQNTQDPVAEFYTVGTYDVTLTASNGFGTDATPAIENMYVQVAAAATGIGCDTLRNYIPADPLFIATVGANNYTNGHQTLGGENSLEWAEQHTATSSTQVRGLDVAVFKAVDGGGDVIFKVYPDNAGAPGATPLATETVPVADFTELAWNSVNFTTPASVTGNFWVGYELDYSGLDTFVLFTGSGGALTQNHVWVNRQVSGWTDIATILTPAPMYAAGVEVLTSTGTAPAMNFTFSNDSVCQGGDILVDGSISTNTNSYDWFVDDAFPPTNPVLDASTSSSNTFNFPYTPGIHYIYLFGEGSCLTDVVALAVDVLAPVTAVATPTATTCGNNNGSITVTGAAGGDGTYFYSLDGTNYQTGNTFTGLAAGNYDVYIATLGSDCEAVYNVTVAASTPATATASANQTICPGGSATITATGGGTYSWSDGSTNIGSSASIVVSPTVNTQYSCLVTDGSGCPTTVFTDVNINIPVPPTISASGATTICAGNTVNLTSSSPTGNTWSTSETSSTITVGTTGSYTVTANDANGCPATSAPFAVTVNPAPTIAAGTVTNPSACATATGSIQVTGPASGSISWTGTSSGNSGGSVSLPYTISGLAAGSYNITLVDGTGCTSNLLAQPLSDPAAPATPTISNSGALTFCDGGSVTLTSSYAGVGNSWTTGASTDNITVTTSQTISVTYTDGSGCSSTSAPITVTVNPLPSAPTITPGGSAAICAGETLTLSSSQGSGNSWSTGATTQDIDVTTAGSYDVTFTDANGCTATSTATVVTVNPLPAAPTISAGGPTTFCAGGDVTLTSSQATGNTWSNGDIVQNTVITTSGNYDVTYTDGNGCSATSTPITVTVNPLPAQPTISASGATTICDGETVTLSSSQATGNAWSTGATTQDIDVSTSGSYDVTYTDANGCSSTSNATAVVVNPLPTVTMAALSQVCDYTASFTLTGGTPAGGTYSGTGVAGGDFDPATAGLGTHTITYEFTDANGCTNTASEDIVVDACLSIDEVSQSGLLIYPNPTDNVINVELNGEFDYSVQDASGRLITTGNGIDKVSISLQHVETGVYFINVTDIVNDTVSTTRVVKQ